MDRCIHVCVNGHMIFSRTHIQEPEFCEICGSKMIDKCPYCQSVIMEWNYGKMIVVGDPEYTRASYCKHCGKPYPWTQSAVESAKELIEEEDELDEIQRNKLLSSLPDIVSETPKTQVAVVRFKKALLTVGKFTAEGLRKFIIDFGCELAKNQFGI